MQSETFNIEHAADTGAFNAISDTQDGVSHLAEFMMLRHYSNSAWPSGICITFLRLF